MGEHDEVGSTRLISRSDVNRLLVGLPFTVAGVVVAARLVPAFEVGGSFGQQALAVGIIALAVEMTRPLISWMFQVLLRAVHSGEPELFAVVRWGTVFVAVLATHLAADPLGLWLGAWVAHSVALPTVLDGLWPTIAAGRIPRALTILVAFGTAVLVRPVDGERRWIHIARMLAVLTLPLGGLLAALAVLPGADAVGTPAAMVALSLTMIAGSGISSSLLSVPVAGPALWLWISSFLSGWMVAGVNLRGWSTYLLAGAIVSVAVIPIFRNVTYRRGGPIRSSPMISHTWPGVNHVWP